VDTAPVLREDQPSIRAILRVVVTLAPSVLELYLMNEPLTRSG
jgi:hypothetical protein